MRPTIDHSVLSPNGRVSQRARKAALERTRTELFPPGFWDAPERTPQQLATERAVALRRAATNLRDLAQRGMSPKRHLRAAIALETEACKLDPLPPSKAMITKRANALILLLLALACQAPTAPVSNAIPVAKLSPPHVKAVKPTTPLTPSIHATR